MKYEIEIPRTLLHRSSVVLLIGLGLAGLVLLGYRNSPLSREGQPVLLSPRLAGITRYQHAAFAWAGELQGVQAGLGSLLANPPADLLEQDGRANAIPDRLALLQSEVEGTTVPPTLQVLHTAIQNTLDQSTRASAATLTWISEPSAQNYTTALDSLELAAAALARLDQDPWMLQP